MLLSSYFKLVQIFVNTMTVNNGLRFSVVYNVHEELNYLYKGLLYLPKRYRKEYHPVVVFDNVTPKIQKYI